MSRQITGQANINAQEMQEFLFPLPPLQEQKAIAKNIQAKKEEVKIILKHRISLDFLLFFIFC